MWSERIEAMLLAAIRDRHLVPDDQVMDVRFDEYMADQMGVLRRVYDLAGVELTDDTEPAAARRPSTTDPGAATAGSPTDLEDVGIDAGRAPGRPPRLPGALRRPRRTARLIADGSR